MERIKSNLTKLEKWFIENDLHIYLGALTIVVVSCLSWMLHTEIQKNSVLRQQLLTSVERDVEQERKIGLLQAELATKQISTAPSKPVVETVEVVSNKLNDKINKVQSTLINNKTTPSTKVITKTETRTVEKRVLTDAELQAIMKRSFCTSFPEDKACKVKK